MRHTCLTAAIALLVAACARQQAPAQPYRVGQTAVLEGWGITVHHFSTLPPDQWHQPSEGHVFCIVELTLENRSGQIRYFMPEKQMLLMDEDGRVYPPDHTAGVVTARQRDWTVPDGEMSVGEMAHGAASYEIPSDVTELHWVFHRGLFPWLPKVTFALGGLP
ncbi:MAG TPA: DUF4352 domain-containing protein [Anaerolineae bacterium]|nr:DUF4352 domain-containing protein [Anaerolineae bacterium]